MVHECLGLLCSLYEFLSIIMKQSSLFLVIFFALKTTWSDISIATSTFISISMVYLTRPFILLTYLCLYIERFLTGSCFLSNVCLLTEVSTVFICNVLIDIVESSWNLFPIRPICSLFYLSFFCLLLSLLYCFYDSILSSLLANKLFIYYVIVTIA